MKTRVITGIVAILLFIPICYFSYTVVFPIAIGILCAVGVFEMAKCLKLHKNLILTIPMYIVALGLPVFRFFLPSNTQFLACALVALFGILIFLFTFVVIRKNKDDLNQLLSFFTLFIYVVGCFSSLVMIRCSTDGKFMYLLAFLGAWICDTFAYFVGMLFGKHKLIPEISPKKTVEGSIGGIVFTICGFALYGLIVNSFFGAELSYIKLCILGAVLSIVSQIGDLIASCIKRKYEIKDYGFIFPGHGGVLDRFDSVMLVAPVLYLLNVLI